MIESSPLELATNGGRLRPVRGNDANLLIVNPQIRSQVGINDSNHFRLAHIVGALVVIGRSIDAFLHAKAARVEPDKTFFNDYWEL